MRRNEERKQVVTKLQTGRWRFKKANGDGRKRIAPAGQTPGPSQSTTRYPRGDTSRRVLLNHETAPQSTEEGRRSRGRGHRQGEQHQPKNKARKRGDKGPAREPQEGSATKRQRRSNNEGARALALARPRAQGRKWSVRSPIRKAGGTQKRAKRGTQGPDIREAKGGWFRSPPFEGTLQGVLKGSSGDGGGWGSYPLLGSPGLCKNTCGQWKRQHFFSTQDSASLEPCGVRMKDMN